MMTPATDFGWRHFIPSNKAPYFNHRGNMALSPFPFCILEHAMASLLLKIYYHPTKNMLLLRVSIFISTAFHKGSIPIKEPQLSFRQFADRCGIDPGI